MKGLVAFFKKYKKPIIKILILLAIAILISALVLVIMRLTGVITVDDGLKFNAELFSVFTTSWYGYLLFYLIQVAGTLLLCFAPVGTSAFIALGVILYGPTVYTFLLLYAGVITSSVLMDLIGRFGGSRLVKRIFGDDEFKKGKKILQEKGTIYLPAMYLFPLFPDDVLCCLAGTIKLNFWYHLLIIVLCRGVGVATILFGLNIIPYKDFTTAWEWIVAITVIAVWIYLIFKAARYIDKKYTIYRKNKIENENQKIAEQSEEIVNDNK